MARSKKLEKNLEKVQSMVDGTFGGKTIVSMHAVENVKASGDKNKLNTLKLQLDKLNAIGGIDSIVPSEGLVFKYKGKTYKFTGAFAPVNQITGLISF